MFIQKERIRCVTAQKEDACSDYQPKEYVQRRSLTQLIYKGLDDVKTISQEQYEQVLKSSSAIADLYVTIKEFYEIIYEYYGAAEPLVRCGESHLSGLTEPLRSLV